MSMFARSAAVVGAGVGVGAPVAAARLIADHALARPDGATATFSDFVVVGTGAGAAGLAVAGAGALALRAGAAGRGFGLGAATGGLAAGATAFAGSLLIGSVWERALATLRQ